MFHRQKLKPQKRRAGRSAERTEPERSDNGSASPSVLSRVFSRYFSRAFTIWSKQSKFTPAFITNLMSHTEADHAAGAWLLLSKVVASAPGLRYDRILDAWEAMFR